VIADALQTTEEAHRAARARAIWLEGFRAGREAAEVEIREAQNA
jgi:hypothetical protein